MYGNNNNGGYGQPNYPNYNYNQFAQGQYPTYPGQSNYNNYGFQNAGSVPPPSHNQPKWHNKPKVYPKHNNQRRPPKQAARGYPPRANFNLGAPFPAGNQYPQQGGYAYHQAPQPVPYQQSPNRPPQPRPHAPNHPPKQPGYGPPGHFRGNNARPSHQGRGRGGQGAYGARGPRQQAPYQQPQPFGQLNLLSSQLNALASLGPLAPAVLNNMDTQQLVNLLLTPTQNIVTALPSSQPINRPPQNLGRGQGRAQPGHRKVIPSKKFAPKSRGVQSGPPQRPGAGARQQQQSVSHEPKPKKDKLDNFSDNINKTFVSSLVKPDNSYMTAVFEHLDEFECVDSSAVREQILRQIVARTKTDVTTTQAIVTLLESGYSVPFIHAYRRDITERKSLADLREIDKQWRDGNNLAKYKQYILHAIFTKGKLTADLKTKILAATSSTEVADYYIPIKLESNPRTAPIKVVGLDKLTAKLLEQTPFDTPNMNLHAFAMSFIKPGNCKIATKLCLSYCLILTRITEQGYPDYPSVMKAAVQLAAEQICADQSVRDHIRQHFTMDVIVKCSKSNKLISMEKQNKDQDTIKRAHKFRDYFQVFEPLANMSNTRLLTMNKGEREGYLHVDIEFKHDVQAYLKSRYFRDPSSDYALYIVNAIEQAWRHYLLPIFTAEVRARATERASEAMTSVIYNGAYQTVLQPPVRGAVMGIDPGYKSGCRVAVVNERGVLQGSTLIYPHPPISQPAPAKESLLALFRQHSVIAVAIAQGFGARETERFLANINTEFKTNIKFMIVNEVAAVSYAASDLGREELPSLDTQMRAAVSVARRLQDPLEELVKVEVDAIGVHPLQQDVVNVHTVLESAVTDAVNSSLIDVNTASLHRLRHVSGLNVALAHEIVSYRAQHKFTSRQQLLAVPQFTAQIYEQCAGFVRIAIDLATNALDSTQIHPADYSLAEKVLQSISETVDSIKTSEGRAAINTKLSGKELSDEYLQELDAPLRREAVRYIVAALKDPLSDARDSMPKPALRADVPRMTDLTIGKIVEGVATNITTFGIFVDIGMKQTGFVHKTEVSNNAADTPASAANVGDVLRARVTSLDFQRDRIVLSLRNVPSEGESVPIPEQSTGESTNNNNTNVMTDENQPTSTLTSDGAWEEAHGEGSKDENIEMHAEADDVESGGEQEQEQEAEEFDEPQGEEYPYEGEEYAQDMQTEDYEEEQQGEEQQDNEQQGEEQQHDEQLSTAHDTTDASTGTDGNNFEEQ